MDDLAILQTLGAPGADDQPVVDAATEPAQGGEPATPPPGPTAAELEEMRKQLKALEESNRTLETRFHDTQRWGNDQNQARIMAEGILEARRRDEGERRAAEAAAAQHAFPQLSEDQREQLVADPVLLDQYIRANNEATARSILAQVQPQLQASQAVAAMLGPMIERQASSARVEARSLATSQGVDAAEFDSLVDSADRYIQQAARGDWHTYHNLRMDPRAVAQAVIWERQSRGGAPVSAAPRAPSLGAGDRRPEAPRPASIQRTDKMKKLESSLGVSITADDIAAYNQRRAAQGRR